MADPVLDRLSALSTPLVADALVRLGRPIRIASAAIRPIDPSMRLAGRARTVRHFGSVDVFLEAIEGSTPGEVLVIDNEARDDEGCIGDLTALEAMRAGLGGTIVWGRHRDSAELREIGWPVFSTGAHAVGPRELRPRQGDPFGPVWIDGIETRPGEFVVADADGVLILPADDVEEVIELAGSIRRTEREQANDVLAGRSLRSQLRFADYLRARASDPALTFRDHLRRIGGAIEE